MHSIHEGWLNLLDLWLLHEVSLKSFLVELSPVDEAHEKALEEHCQESDVDKDEQYHAGDDLVGHLLGLSLGHIILDRTHERISGLVVAA